MFKWLPLKTLTKIGNIKDVLEMTKNVLSFVKEELISVKNKVELSEDDLGFGSTYNPIRTSS